MLRLMRWLAVCIFAALPAVHAVAQQPAAIPVEMKPLAFMADACWEGPMPNGQVIAHCLRWVMGGRVLRDTMRIEDATPPVRGETTYYWDIETKTLRYIFLSVDGPHSVGTVKTNGDQLVFDDERLVGRSGLIHFRTTFTPTGPDSYVQRRDRQGPDGVWKENPETTFVRKPLR